MTRSSPTDRNRKRFKIAAHLLTGLFFFFILACCGQTADTGDPPLGQTTAQTQLEDTGKKTIPQQGGRQAPYAPDQVLVKFKPETDAKTIARVLKELNLETIRKFSSPNLFLLKITEGKSVEAIITRLNDHQAVKYAEPNYEVKATQ